MFFNSKTTFKGFCYLVLKIFLQYFVITLRAKYENWNFLKRDQYFKLLYGQVLKFLSVFKSILKTIMLNSLVYCAKFKYWIISFVSCISIYKLLDSSLCNNFFRIYLKYFYSSLIHKIFLEKRQVFLKIINNYHELSVFALRKVMIYQQLYYVAKLWFWRWRS